MGTSCWCFQWSSGFILQDHDQALCQYHDARGKARGFICAKFHAIWQLFFHFGHHGSICQTINHSCMLHPIKSAASPVTLHANIFLPYSLKIWNLCHCRAVVSPTSLRFCLCVCARVCLITGVVSAVWESGHQLQAIIVTVLLCFKYLVPTSALRACRFCSFVFC